MDRDDLTLISLWVHVPVVTAWVGLVLYDVVVAAVPGLAAPQRGRLIAWSRPLVVVALAVILVTGVWQTIENPLLRVTSWSELGELRQRTYGLALFWKHGFVLATFALTVVVRFVLAPRLAAGKVAAGDGAPAQASRTDAAAVDRLTGLVLWLSVLNLAACLGALLLATLMVFQLH
jgi:ABC-type multidrug transport system fused ATPase/permease subunit